MVHHRLPWIALLLATWACKPLPNASGLDVINGKATPTDANATGYKAVVKIRRLSTSGRSATCTATFITPNIAVTAAHCTDMFDGQPTAISYNGVTAVQGIRPDGWVEGSKANGIDVALLIFPQAIAPATARLAQTPPRAGQEFMIVGFGASSRSADTLTPGNPFGRGCIDYVFQGSGALNSALLDLGYEDDALSAPGDSGGPIFINDEIVAVVSGGGELGDLNPETRNQFASLNSPCRHQLERYSIYASLFRAEVRELLQKHGSAAFQYQSNATNQTAANTQAQATPPPTLPPPSIPQPTIPAPSNPPPSTLQPTKPQMPTGPSTIVYEPTSSSQNQVSKPVPMPTGPSTIVYEPSKNDQVLNQNKTSNSVYMPTGPSTIVYQPSGTGANNQVLPSSEAHAQAQYLWQRCAQVGGSVRQSSSGGDVCVCPDTLQAINPSKSSCSSGSW